MTKASCNNCGFFSCKIKPKVNPKFGYTCREWEHYSQFEPSDGESAFDSREPNYDNIRLAGLSGNQYLVTGGIEGNALFDDEDESEE